MYEVHLELHAETTFDWCPHDPYLEMPLAGRLFTHTGEKNNLSKVRVFKTPLNNRPIKIVTNLMLSNRWPWTKIMQRALLKNFIYATCLLLFEVEEVAGNIISVWKFFCFLLPLPKYYWVLFLYPIKYSAKMLCE